MGAVFALFSGWYFWIPKILGLDYNILYSKAHFWVLFTGVNLTFFPQHFLGLQGMPRRISDYPDAFTGWNFVSSVGSIVSVVATALFLHIVYLQLVKGKAVYGYPWAVPQLFSDYLRILKDKCAPGLEWALSNPPKPHAFTSLPLQSSSASDLNKINSQLDTFENTHIPNATDMKASAGNSLTILDTVRDECVARVQNSTTELTSAINNATLTTQDKNELTQLNTEIATLKTRHITEAHDTARDLIEASQDALSPFITTTAVGPAISTLFVLLRVYFDKSFRYFSSVFYSIYKTRINLIFITLVMFLVVYYSSSVIYCDAPRAWGLYFQDSASPQMEALVELHDNIMYYLVAILFAVGWIQGAIIKNFNSAKAPISNKYLNHGKRVPIQKYSNYIQKKYYSTSSIPEIKEEILPLQTEINIIKLYENATLKKQIIDENKNKSGIYLFTNLLNKDQYVGQSIDLGKRFTKYFTLSYLKNRNTLVISRALIKYGYANFSISILEYCDKDILNEREQYYMDIIKPVYNTLKIAGSSSGYKHTQESKDKRSLSLKGKYTGTNSPLYGRTHTEQTKELMSSMRKGQDNYFYGKTHTHESKELMEQKAIGRKHSPSTLEKMSKVKGNPVNIYENCNSEGFNLIGNFISARKAGLFLGISGSTIIKYMHSGEVFKDRYQFSGQAPK